jgi:transcriptional regulator with XRE-family HTH domain
MVLLMAMKANREPPPMNARNYVREWREFRKLKQEKLAEKAGYSAATISQLETGKQGYEEKTLVRLAAALDCEPSDLIAGPPELAPLVNQVRNLPPDRREDVIDALMRLLVDLKRIGKIAG